LLAPEVYAEPAGPDHDFIKAGPTKKGEGLMLTLFRPFGDLFRDDAWSRDWDVWSGAQARSFSPAVDVVNTPDAFLLKAEVPGLSADDVDIEVHENVLTLRGERKLEHKDEREGYRRIERRYGSFARSFMLPDGVHADAIEATLENGVLTLRIPRAVEAQPRRIAVKSGAGLVDKARGLFSQGKNGNVEQAPEQPTAG
jgi:HSP20 family protein